MPLECNKSRELRKPRVLSLKTINFKLGINLNLIALEQILEKYLIIKQQIEYKKSFPIRELIY